MSVVITEIMPLSSASSISSISSLSPISSIWSPVVPIILQPATGSVTLTPASPDTPYVASVNFGYTTPVICVYDNLNADPVVHDRMTKYYYHKILEKWLHDDLLDILSYLKTKGNEIDIIDKMSDYQHGSAAKDSAPVREKKIEFIEQFFLTKSFVHRVINEFVISTPANWYDLYRHEYLLMSIFQKKLISRIKKAIMEKESLRNGHDSFITRKRWFSAPASTGGTTGIPLSLVRSRRCLVFVQGCQDLIL